MDEQQVVMGKETEVGGAVEIIVGSDLQADAPPKTPVNIQAGMSFTLLGTDFKAAFQKSGLGYEILVMPVSDNKSNGMKISEMVDEIVSMMGNSATPISDESKAEMKKSIEGAVSSTKKEEGETDGPAFNPMNIKINLKQAFFYCINDGTTTKVEYAFSLGIGLEEMTPKDIKVIKINEIALSVWNTDRIKVLERMQLGSIKELLDR